MLCCYVERRNVVLLLRGWFALITEPKMIEHHQSWASHRLRKTESISFICNVDLSIRTILHQHQTFDVKTCFLSQTQSEEGRGIFWICRGAAAVWIQNAAVVRCTCTRGCTEWHCKVGQNSKQGKSQWQPLARTASDVGNYANELISVMERTDKTKRPLFNHSWGLLKWWSQIYNACPNIHTVCVCVCVVHVQSKHHLKERLVSSVNRRGLLAPSSLPTLTPAGYRTRIYGASEGWCFSPRSEICCHPFCGVLSQNCNQEVQRLFKVKEEVSNISSINIRGPFNLNLLHSFEVDLWHLYTREVQFTWIKCVRATNDNL